MMNGAAIQNAPDMVKLGLTLFSLGSFVIVAVLWQIGWRKVAVLLLVMATAFVTGRAMGRDPDGRYANSPLKAWFDSLTNKRGGSCCSLADGIAIADVDGRSKDGHYEVFVDSGWQEVPDYAVITEPNRAGKTMLWRIPSITGPQIQCFMPGPMT
jgi:hypothetical protein